MSRIFEEKNWIREMQNEKLRKKQNKRGETYKVRIED